MHRVMRAAAGALARCADGGLGAAGASAACASRAFHATGGALDSLGHVHRSGMSATTVLCVRKGDQVVMIGDGQVTMGSEVVKPNVKKVRRIGTGVIGGFAGATADAFTLFERLENKLEEHPGQLTRACVELAKAWRMDKFLRRLDAVMVVADETHSLQITGTGDVLEPHDGIIAIGSGGPYALAAARALIDIPGMDAMTIAKRAMTIAADTCIYTNHNFVIESMKAKPAPPAEDEPGTGAADTAGDAAAAKAAAEAEAQAERAAAPSAP